MYIQLYLRGENKEYKGSPRMEPGRLSLLVNKRKTREPVKGVKK